MFFVYTAAALSVFLYSVLISKLFKDNTQQNLATWALWGILDLITLKSVYDEGGNWIILALYVLGCTVICAVLAVLRQFGWGSFENFVIVLVAACLLFWRIGGSRWGMIAGTVSVALATLPQIRDSLKLPDKNTVSIWFGFLIVNILYFFAGKSWELKEILYPGVCAVLCLTLTIANSREPVKI